LIQLTRSLARQLRAVLRNSVLAGANRGTPLTIACCTGQQGLTIRAQGAEVGVEYHQPGELPPDSIRLSGEALDDFNGTKSTPVILENAAKNTVQARWDDAGVPQLKDYGAKDDHPLPEFPAAVEWAAQEPRLLTALAEAAKTTAKDTVRYALVKMQLRGARGQVVATDGRQLFVEAGFVFPWEDDVIVPAVPAFGSKGIPSDTVAISRTPTHVGICVGPWTFWLQIDLQGRYPRTDEVIPAKASRKTICRLTAGEVDFLARTLPRMPGQEDPDDPVTVDLNGHLTVRTKGEGQTRITEVGLSHSTITGPSVRFRTNRCYLARALGLGLAELQIVDASTPVVCQDEKRTYVWMPLDKKGALAPTDDAVRISPPTNTVEPSPQAKERSEPHMSSSAANGTTNGASNGLAADGQPAANGADNGSGKRPPEGIGQTPGAGRQSGRPDHRGPGPQERSPRLLPPHQQATCRPQAAPTPDQAPGEHRHGAQAAPQHPLIATHTPVLTA
jgi:hypothetical protein